MGLKLCLHPGCLAPTFSSRCTEHERQYQKARNADPKRAAYNAHKGRPLTGLPCTCCGTSQDITRHHLQPLANHDPQVRRSLTDITVPMCRPCNSSIGAKVMTDHRCPMHGGTSV